MKKRFLLPLLCLTIGSAYAEGVHQDMDNSKMEHSGMSMNSGMSMDSGMAMKSTSAVGMPAMGAKPDKVVYVMLSDDMKMTFKKEVDIHSDDVVQFVVMNTGKMEHEFAIGSPAEQKKHREMMKTMSGNYHDTDNSVMVKPGKARQFMWHFHGEKTVELSCDIPGHYEAGMTKTLQL